MMTLFKNAIMGKKKKSKKIKFENMTWYAQYVNVYGLHRWSYGNMCWSNNLEQMIDVNLN